MIRLRRPRLLRVALFAAFALLIAQIGAVRHAYAHDIAGVAAAVKQSFPNSHELCSDCLNFAPLLATAGSAGAARFDAAPARPGHYSRPMRTSTRSRPLLAFRSRAPPTAD